MKINEKHLRELSVLKSSADKQGYLNKCGEVNTAFQRRWFVLRANLLFYFDSPDDPEPTGVIVLENCSVSVSQCEDRYAFELSFSGTGTRTYVLAADTQEEMEGWMRALARSSCHYMRAMIAQLQRQLDDLRVLPSATKTQMTEDTSQENTTC